MEVGEMMKKFMAEAEISGRWLMTLTYLDGGILQHVYEKKNFPDDDVEKTLQEQEKLVMSDLTGNKAPKLVMPNKGTIQWR